MRGRHHWTADKWAWVDIERLMELRRVPERALPGERRYESLARAGLALGFVPASSAGTPTLSKMKQAF